MGAPASSAPGAFADRWPAVSRRPSTHVKRLKSERCRTVMVLFMSFYSRHIHQSGSYHSGSEPCPSRLCTSIYSHYRPQTRALHDRASSSQIVERIQRWFMDETTHGSGETLARSPSIWARRHWFSIWAASTDKVSIYV